MLCKAKDNTVTRSRGICDVFVEVLKWQVNEGKTLPSPLKKKIEIVTKSLSLFATQAVGIYLDLLIGFFAYQYYHIF